MFSRVRYLAVVCFLVSFTLAGPLSAANQSWDPGLSNGAAIGGAGTWNSSLANWYNGTSDAVWGGSGNNAVLGGSSGGAVTLSSLSINNLTCNTTGYTISPASQTLTLGGGVVTMNNGASLTISSSIGGSAGLTLNGTGCNLTLGSNEGLSGTVTVNGGTLTLSGPGSGSYGMFPNAGYTNINSGGAINCTAYNLLANGAGHGYAINVNSGGALTITNGNETGSSNLVLNGGTLAAGNWAGGTYGSFAVNNTNFFLVTANSTVAIGGVSFNSSGSTVAAIDVVRGATLTYSGALTNSNNGAVNYLAKAGGGTIVLTNNNTYTGTTLVGAGTLSLTGNAAIGSTPLIGVGQGATLDVSTLNSNLFTLGTAQTLVAGRIGTPGTDINGNIASSGTIDSLGTTTVSGSVTLNGGYVVPDLSSTTSVNNIVTPALTLNNTTNITPAFIVNGAVPVVTSTAPIAGSGTLALGAPLGGGLANWRGSPTGSLIVGTNGSGATVISASYSGLLPAALTCTGTVSTTTYTWNVNSTANWLNGGSADKFYQGDSVTFPAAMSGTVSIASNVYPSSINFTNTGSFYITGGGAISGPASVQMSGTGTVYFGGNNTNNNNTYWGGTTINHGTIQVGNGSGHRRNEREPQCPRHRTDHHQQRQPR